MRSTKLIVTLGPSTEDPVVLAGLVEAGMDVARLNASHAGPAELASSLEAVRTASAEAGRHVAVMLDLAGPKIRVGEMADGVVLEEGKIFELRAQESIGDSSGASVTYPGLAEDVSKGDRILLDDGSIELAVTAKLEGKVRCEVLVGGPLSSGKGVNVPGVRLNVEAPTRFDRAMVEWALAKEVDLVAQSFVRHADDVHQLRDMMRGQDIPIVAKIEKHEAAESVDGIVAAADAVMVARGDLGVETSPESVPVLQRRIIDVCRSTGTPVVIATQMLDSMTTASRPTRAEASDVANSIFDQVDAVMLSGETAIGLDPVRVLKTMSRIVASAEGSFGSQYTESRSIGSRDDVTEAVSAAVNDLAQDLDLAAIVTATQSGATARAVARHRPTTQLVAVTPSEAVARTLQIVWGVHAIVIPLAEDTDRMLEDAADAIRNQGIARAGQLIAITAGVASRVPGQTDFILVKAVPEDDS